MQAAATNPAISFCQDISELEVSLNMFCCMVINKGAARVYHVEYKYYSLEVLY